MADDYRAERTISAVFKEQDQVDTVVRRLVDRGVPSDHISVMGKNFQSQSRIAGFISKKDVILGGLRTGAIFGSLFGSFLSLLTGVGVLFIPFVGPVVSAGPLSAVLLGAASGALAGGAGAGLVSVLAALGMSEEKAAIYQTRLQAGEFLVMVEVPAGKSGEYQLLMQNAGGEEIHTSDMTLLVPVPVNAVIPAIYLPKCDRICLKRLRTPLSSATIACTMRIKTQSRQNKPRGKPFISSMKKMKMAFGLSKKSPLKLGL